MNFFEEFKERGEELIKEFCENQQEESVQLEFKESSGKGGRFSNEDKKNLGKELSAFANSNGGIIIWGIKTEKSDANLDRAASVEPVENISKFYSEAKRLCAEYLAPKHDDIRVIMASSNTKVDAGFLCIDVTRSDRRPHMSLAKDDKRYYKRIQDSAYVMEHFDVEDQMSRKQTASVDFVRRFSLLMKSGSLITVGIQVHLWNHSNVTAEHAYFDFKPTNFISMRGPRNNFIRSSKGNWNGVFSGLNSVINPGDLVHVADLEFDLVSDSHGTFWFKTEHTNRKLVFRSGCKDRKAIGGEINLQDRAIVEELVKELKIDVDPT